MYATHASDSVTIVDPSEAITQVSDDPESSDGEETDEDEVTPDEAPGIIRYNGVAALLVGMVTHINVVLAVEVLGNEVAVTAVAHGLISMENRSLKDTRIAVDDRPIALDKQSHYRMLTTPLSGGQVSCVLLHGDAIIEAPHERSGKRRKRQRTDLGQDAASYGAMAGRTHFCFVTRSAEDTADGTAGLAPEGFVEAFGSILPVPFRSEWAHMLFQQGRAEKLITPLTRQGTLAGYEINLTPAAWHQVIGVVARAAAKMSSARAPGDINTFTPSPMEQ